MNNIHNMSSCWLRTTGLALVSIGFSHFTHYLDSHLIWNTFFFCKTTFWEMFSEKYSLPLCLTVTHASAPWGLRMVTTRESDIVWHYQHVCSLFGSTCRATVPLVCLRSSTASEWVTPSRLCPLTVRSRSPRHRRPSSTAAPCGNSTVTHASRSSTQVTILSQSEDHVS